MSRLEDKVQTSKLKAADGIKKHVFDWIAAIIIVALIAASLDVFGLIDFETISLAEFLISWFPYFAAAILLHTDLYKKGVFVGKDTKNFKAVIASYSRLANSLTGQQIKNLYPFCEKYNDDVKETIQTQILRKEGLSFEDYDKGWTVVVQNETIMHSPLKVRDKAMLLEQGYTKRQIAAIFAAKKVKVKGINVNILLSSTDAKDITDIGDDAKSLQTKQILMSAIKNIVTTFLLSVIAIKNIGDRGWIGLLLTLFKVAYLFAGCCMSYFKGYDDVTINLANHFTRKSDILKMYIDYIPEKVDYEDDDVVED